ncbi:MAG TPA: OmpH family outer membrane protein [Stellaceae bacterium]|jgi:urease accessory protein UreF|nr:OmpH family outer membrane protein [Stellaceae bacterium]
MTFTPIQQDKHRKTFIEDCYQKAWGAACHAEWIGKQLDDLTAQYQKLKIDETALDAEIATLAAVLDSHTKDNREKRKELQQRGTALLKAGQALAQNMQQGQNAMQQLYASVESAMALAAHAEGWSWKKAESAPAETNAA